MFEKDMHVSFLADFYGEVLPEKQRRLLDLYYNEDLSLAEIAERSGLTRQGVRHSLKKAEEELLFLESKLGLADHFLQLGQMYDTISTDLTKVIGLVRLNAKAEDVVPLLEKVIHTVQQQKQIGE